MSESTPRIASFQMHRGRLLVAAVAGHIVVHTAVVAVRIVEAERTAGAVPRVPAGLGRHLLLPGWRH